MTTPDPDVTARIDSGVPFTPPPHENDAQFAPGTIIAGRYRISSILGSGGMGEVYRADDTKLGQTVALKFLPARLARDPVLLGRLHDEVRLGRVIAHPNVCRLYDIADWDGAHFVAMEYVDGEDLSRLLRRIGRLAHDKAVDIARGIAAGLMAAHAKGILHRDLKPANVMIDSNGDARIMDFGLALAAGEDDGTIAGTPAYMAPEQIHGEPATVQSDLYALGLVMYELSTGKRAHNARSIHERARDLTSEITTPSSHIPDIDPAVERIILRCLSNDPAQRPRSAREVIQSLPGGDPLAAALAAGETPSPRVVAAAGTEGSLKPWLAWTLLAGVVVCLLVTLEGKRVFGTGSFAPFETSRDVLVERAVTTLRALGIPAQPYRTHTLASHDRYLAWIHDDPSPRRWERLRKGPAAIHFELVESARPLPPGVPNEIVNRPGTTSVSIDLRGRLVSLSTLPGRDWPARPLDWNALLAAAGLDAAKLTATTPRLLPSSPTDARIAWSGRHPDDGTPIHVEAAAWRGTPVFLQISGPWESATLANVPFSNVRLAVFATVLVVSVIVIGVLLAWRNMRLRRGDRAGAFRVALTMLVLNLTTELLIADHQAAGLHEIDVLRRALESSLLWAAVVYVLYLALEPFVRRRWPDHLIASGRLIAGNARDPMVGRDVLIGILVGLMHPAIIFGTSWFNARAGEPADLFLGDLSVIAGTRHAVGHVANSLASGAFQGFVVVVILVTFMLALRRRLAATVAMGLLMMTGYYVATGAILISTTLVAILIAFTASRFGLLATAVAQTVFLCVFHHPLFTSGSWQSIQILPVAFVVVAAVWAFYGSLGGQSPFNAAMLDE
ncbi:MAG: serine/threonine-protein kinase [Thermoanaerobaculia bacterium]